MGDIVEGERQRGRSVREEICSSPPSFQHTPSTCHVASTVTTDMVITADE